ncbi:MAG: FAD/NAD(P)-binding oxidoreductase [Pseudomonadota bacterium]
MGCETALWLAQKGKNVTILEKLGEVMKAGFPVPRMNRLMLLDLIKLYRVSIITSADVLNITKGFWSFRTNQNNIKRSRLIQLQLPLAYHPIKGFFAH